ncbi:hypothetical protein ABID13_005649 [Enterocloster citroniae]|uniref:Uncharacterized protein n=1 Tax=Enterocloster citroniae TaxID=358743 RepID=A0ABV2G6R6_9FIRM
MKKTVMDWVFRKSGVLALIYGDNAGKYEDIITSLPADMRKKMTTNDGMFFLLTDETAEHIAELVCAKVTVHKSAS